MQNFLGCPATANQDSAQEEGQLSSKGTRVDVGFVEDENPQRIAEENGVLRATQHILQHRVVGDENIWDLPAGLLAGPSTAGIEFWVAGPVCGFIVLGRFTGEVEERNV